MCTCSEKWWPFFNFNRANWFICVIYCMVPCMNSILIPSVWCAVFMYYQNHIKKTRYCGEYRTNVGNFSPLKAKENLNKNSDVRYNFQDRFILRMGISKHLKEFSTLKKSLHTCILFWFGCFARWDPNELVFLCSNGMYLHLSPHYVTEHNN